MNVCNRLGLLSTNHLIALFEMLFHKNNMFQIKILIYQDQTWFGLFLDHKSEYCCTWSKPGQKSIPGQKFVWTSLRILISNQTNHQTPDSIVCFLYTEKCMQTRDTTFLIWYGHMVLAAGSCKPLPYCHCTFFVKVPLGIGGFIQLV